MASRPCALVLNSIIAAAGTGLAAAQDKAPELAETLTEQNFAAWCDHIRADRSERDWAEMPWLMTFHDGLQAAAKAKKPLLLWTMNGHPFGCT